MKDLEYDENIGDWIIDTDPGIDDAFAITLSINFLKDKLKLISITGGNTGTDQCVKNAKKLCVLNKRKFNISKGESLTVSSSKLKGASHIHGTDGFFDFKEYEGLDEKYDNPNTDYINKTESKELSLLKSHSAIEIVKISKNYDNINKKLNLIAIGPLTNIALALMIDPSITKRINKMVIMGGTYLSKGNIIPNGEFNFAFDCVAAKKVLNKFENIVIYPWETAWDYLIYSENCKFNEDTKEVEKRKFCEKTVKEKESRNQGGVFCDYGGAVVGYYPESIISPKEFYCDIEIASTDLHTSKFLVSKENIFPNKNKKKILLVDKLNAEIYYRLFNQMINCK